MLLLPVLTKAQFTISGVVSETNHQALPGATIRLKGKSFGVTADGQGKYQLKNLKAGSYTLVVSFIGYQMTEKNLELKADQVENISLKPAAFLADEVIVNEIGRASCRERV